MKIAVVSDIHENFHNLTLCLEQLETCKVDRVLCLGDLMNNGIAKTLASLPMPVHMIWGNNDGSRVAMMRTILSPNSNMTAADDTFDFITIDGRRIFMTHYPSLAKPVAKSGDVDVVFFGHSHYHHIETVNNCLLVNPGELSAHKSGIASFALYDTTTHTAEIIELEESISINTPRAIAWREAHVKFAPRKRHEY